MKSIFILTAFCFISSLSIAQSGNIDSSFGVNGKVITGFSIDNLQSLASAKQNDDKIVVVGFGYIIRTDTSFGFLAMRYTKDGIVDSSFGNNGITIVNVGDDYISETAQAVAIQGDGKIVMTGYAAKGLIKTNYDIPTVRLNANGSIDSSFGNNGIVIADYGSGDVGHDILIQPDGKILVEGASSGYFITLRYLSNGSLDQNFGEAGKVITTFTGLATGTSVALQPDGKIVAAGHDEDQVLLTRYLSNGITDESFGSNGEVRSNFTKLFDRAYDMALQTDGKILIVGDATSFFKDTAFLARYNTDGSLDNSFGINGLSKLPDTSGIARVMLQKDGTIITSGYGFTVSKFKSDGTTDSSFGTNGHTTTEGIGQAYGLCIQGDNKIVLSGFINDSVTSHITLARYNNDINQKQILITKIRRWLQHHNGFTWDANNNVSSYMVQRSYDGIHFNSIARINTSNTSNYTYQDQTAFTATNYYRLQTTSVSGAVNYSNVIAVTNDNIKISPNPAKNVLHLEGLPTSNIKLTVVDFAGNVAISKRLTTNNNSYNLNIASLQTGNYLLKIETNDDIITKQFIKE